MNRGDLLAFAIGGSFGLMLAAAVLMIGEEAKAARDYCASIGQFADNPHGEWVCVDRPEWQRIPK